MERKKWEGDNIVLALIIPLQFFLAYLMAQGNVFKTSLGGSLATLALASLAFFLAVGLRKDLLREDFREFRKEPWRNTWAALVSAIIFGAIISYGKKFLGLTSLDPLAGVYVGPEDFSILELVLGSLVAIMAPFTEEIIFRYEFFYRLRDSKLRNILLALGSSILFGLFHLNNYGGEVLPTLPIMLVGLFLSMIYRKSGNIWTNISAHFIYNFSLSVLPTIFIVILQFFTR